MKITNRLNLPSAFVEMAQQDYTFAPNEYRVTSLLKGMRQTILERRHHDEIEQDVSDMIWLLFGTAVHGILERQQEGANELKEERVKVVVGDYILSGQFDLYSETEKQITDYKTCSIWKIIHQDYSDWRKQLLIYAWMMRSIGFEVNSGQVVALAKDHSKSKAKFDATYPQYPVVPITFEFSEKDFIEIEFWIASKFQEIAIVETFSDDDLPICTDEERWYTGDKYAVMAKGRKSALRVLDSWDDAVAWMGINDKGDSIVERKGEDKRCDEYCSVNQFCNYYLEKTGGKKHECLPEAI